MLSKRICFLKFCFKRFSTKTFQFDSEFTSSKSKYSLKADLPEGAPIYLKKPITENKNIFNSRALRRNEQKSLKTGKLTILPKPSKKVLTEHPELMKTNETVDRDNMRYITDQRANNKQHIIDLFKRNKERKQNALNAETLVEFEQPERLAKRMSKLGICSRRQAERLINANMVKVDGKAVESNMAVSSNNHIEILDRKGYITPVPSSVGLYLYYKPKGVDSVKSERKTATVADALQFTELAGKHLIPIVCL